MHSMEKLENSVDFVPTYFIYVQGTAVVRSNLSEDQESGHHLPNSLSLVHHYTTIIW